MIQEKHGDLLKTYNEKWNLVKDLIVKDFDVEVVHGDKHASAKIMPCKDETKTDFQQNQLPPGKTKYLTSLIILTNSVYRIDKSYQPQALLKDCRYKIKKK